MKATTAIFVCMLLLPSHFYGQEKTSSAGVPAQGPEEVKSRYRAVQVDPVTIQEDVQFPAEFLMKLQAEIAKQLSKQKEFEEVLAEGQSPAKAGAPVLRLSEQITSYERGNRAERYLGGFGAGSTVVNAKVVFMDGESGQTFMAENLRAVLSGGFLGGSAEGVVQDFARQIVTKTKLMLAKRIPAPGDSTARIEEASPAETAPGDFERQTIELPGPDWKTTEEKLNQESASGFRVQGINLIGKSKAEAVLVKASASPDPYEYRLLHTILVSTLEKEMNEASAAGFRMAKESLATVGNGIAVIMEKSPSDHDSQHYQYRVNQALRVSSSQKNTEKNEASGFDLVAESEHGAAHILVFEKSSDSTK